MNIHDHPHLQTVASMALATLVLVGQSLSDNLAASPSFWPGGVAPAIRLRRKPILWPSPHRAPPWMGSCWT